MDHCTATPDHFICPLTLEVMDDPVQHKVTKHNYERGAILHWIYFGNATCPLTRQPLDPSHLDDNQELQKEIRAWRGEEKSNVCYPEVIPPPHEEGRSAAEQEEEQSCPKKHVTKKEKALLKRLQKLRRSRAKKESSTTTCN